METKTLEKRSCTLGNHRRQKLGRKLAWAIWWLGCFSKNELFFQFFRFLNLNYIIFLFNFWNRRELFEQGFWHFEFNKYLEYGNKPPRSGLERFKETTPKENVSWALTCMAVAFQFKGVRLYAPLTGPCRGTFHRRCLTCEAFAL
jgi:hypothetical protein